MLEQSSGAALNAALKRESVIRKLAFAAVAAGVLGGCSAMPSLNPLNWWSGDPGPKMAELTDIKPTVPLRQLWQASVGPSAGAVFFPVVVAGSVYAADSSGAVTRLEAASGRTLWRASAGKPISGGVGTDGNVVVVGAGDGEVIAMEAENGSVRWRARVSSEVLAAPAVTGDVVAVRSADNRVFGLDAKDGRRRWVYQRANLPLTVRSPAGVVLSRGYAYAGFAGGKLVSIALSNGGARWEGTVASPRGATELERVTDVVGLPWVSEREACAVAFQGRVACLDVASGNALWSREMSSVSGLGVDARYIFISDDRGSVHALDRSGGNSVWKQERLSNRSLTAPLALGRDIVVADVQGFVHLLSRENGGFDARAATDGTAITATPVALENGFLVQTRRGGLFAFSLQ